MLKFCQYFCLALPGFCLAQSASSPQQLQDCVMHYVPSRKASLLTCTFCCLNSLYLVCVRMHHVPYHWQGSLLTCNFCFLNALCRSVCMQPAPLCICVYAICPPPKCEASRQASPPVVAPLLQSSPLFAAKAGHLHSCTVARAQAHACVSRFHKNVHNSQHPFPPPIPSTSKFHLFLPRFICVERSGYARTRMSHVPSTRNA